MIGKLNKGNAGQIRLDQRTQLASINYSQAKKILVMNQKGGVGKSTLIAGLLSHLLDFGHKVELIDFDKQRSTHDWALSVIPDGTQTYNPSLRNLSSIAATLRVRRDTEFVLMDAPSNFSSGDMMRYTYFANAIILPMSPSAVDLHASLPFIKPLIDSGVLSSRKLSLSFVINRCLENDTRVERIEQLLKHFRHYPTLGKMSECLQYQKHFSKKKGWMSR